jgi:hypothetical protein
VYYYFYSHAVVFQQSWYLLLLALSANFEVLAALNRKLNLALALCAFQTQHNLLCSLRLFPEDRLGLATITGLLSVISPLS